jgi:hypothetical protein
MACPGRFPSPTPSREASPIPSAGKAGPYLDTEYCATVIDFTAPGSSRKRPRFAETQSDTAVVHEDLSEHCLPATSQRANGKRRVSDPLQQGSHVQPFIDADPDSHQRQRKRVVSTPSISRTPRSPPSSALLVPARPSTPQSPQSPTPQSSRSIDIKLCEKLLQPLTNEDEIGTIYVLRDPSKPDQGYKIGYSHRADYQERIDEHHSRCDFEPKVVHTIYYVENAFRTEQLILLDLKDRQADVTCNGRKTSQHSRKHKEWFQVTEQVAKETVDKWTKFMNEQRPYDERRTLSPFWKYLLRVRKLTNHDHINHDARRKQWSLVLAPPTDLSYLFFIIDEFRRVYWPFCADFFWQALSVAYSFVTLIVFRNTFTSSTFALVSVCACISAARQEPRKKARSKGLWGTST